MNIDYKQKYLKYKKKYLDLKTQMGGVFTTFRPNDTNCDTVNLKKLKEKHKGICYTYLNNKANLNKKLEEFTKNYIKYFKFVKEKYPKDTYRKKYFEKSLDYHYKMFGTTRWLANYGSLTEQQIRVLIQPILEQTKSEDTLKRNQFESYMEKLDILMREYLTKDNITNKKKYKNFKIKYCRIIKNATSKALYAINGFEALMESEVFNKSKYKNQDLFKIRSNDWINYTKQQIEIRNNKIEELKKQALNAAGLPPYFDDCTKIDCPKIVEQKN